MEFDSKNQQQLMELVVDKVFKKHKVSPDANQLEPEEKEKIKNIVSNIQSEVERFLENQEKKVTEQDFDSNNPQAHVKPQPLARQFKANNDVNTVKTFMNQSKK
ncbi:hypothetical protein [Bacillus alkalicellulosilyticus]|uniref:hypothetical protein n=1 Tax=Alkalihalobacterium alkalicellulosilyticum TaxID=1912214 RepID=UPI000996AD54|nr:hypothetical protein [Bacillus alkalicellulosilyticus]